jgi:hypothetical protein
MHRGVGEDALLSVLSPSFVGIACEGKDFVFRFIIEYSSLRDFGPWVIIGLFLYEGFLKNDILASVGT